MLLEVATLVRWTGTHKGEFFDGKVIEHVGVQDQLGIMQQLDAVPGLAGAR